ncbi:MAG: UDP-N-acetylmuramate dehydrogenase [Clostridiales bacterium]|nr:UDP-N-acetylmuramate dehydrogenase [Clostridiales bacterium]
MNMKLMALGAATDLPLSALTSFRIGGSADYVLRPRSYGNIADALRVCTEAKLPVFVLGRGSNILASDGGFRGLILRLDTPLAPVEIIGTRILCCAFTPLSELCRKSVEAGLMGLERLAGIPGSVGGAVAMNAGAYGGEIKQVLRSVFILKDGQMRWVPVSDGDMGYRHSRFSYPDCIVLQAELQLQPDDGSAERVMRECLQARKEKQPLEYPSAGSVFKRPPGLFAGQLIEECGLKGYSIGGAQVSEKHAGFIINAGNATQAEVSALIAYIQNTVAARKGVSLHCEIKRLTEDGTCIS